MKLTVKFETKQVWEKHINIAKFNYNIRPHSDLGHIPFELLFVCFTAFPYIKKNDEKREEEIKDRIKRKEKFKTK